MINPNTKVILVVSYLKFESHHQPADIEVTRQQV